jgi:hypothetical protein
MLLSVWSLDGRLFGLVAAAAHQAEAEEERGEQDAIADQV